MTGPEPGGVGTPELDVAGRVAAAVHTVEGLSLQVPLRTQALRWGGGEAALAVTVHRDRVEVRVVAHQLPLPPLIDRAAVAVRATLAGSGWDRAPLRVVVTELTAAAFTIH